MYKRHLIKSDGRHLILYGRRILPEDIEAPSPVDVGASPRPHLRWHPRRGAMLPQCRDLTRHTGTRRGEMIVQTVASRLLLSE
jgi:hypothetical protein